MSVFMKSEFRSDSYNGDNQIIVNIALVYNWIKIASLLSSQDYQSETSSRQWVAFSLSCQINGEVR